MKKPSQIIKQLAEQEYKEVVGVSRPDGYSFTQEQITTAIIQYLDIPWYKKVLKRLI